MRRIVIASLTISLVIIGILGLSILLFGAKDNEPSLRGDKVYTPAIALEERVAPDFTLVDQDGQQFTLSRSSGRISLIYFGYTNCPDVCPQVLTNFAAVAQALGENSEQVDMMMITTDPQRDTREALTRYVGLFDSRIKGLSGSPEQLGQVWSAYNVPFEYVRIGNGTDYLVSHFSLVLVVDKDQVMRFAFTPEMAAEEYIRGVRSLL